MLVVGGDEVRNLYGVERRSIKASLLTEVIRSPITQESGESLINLERKSEEVTGGSGLETIPLMSV